MCSHKTRSSITTLVMYLKICGDCNMHCDQRRVVRQIMAIWRRTQVLKPISPEPSWTCSIFAIYLSALRAELSTVPFLREPCSWTFLLFMFFQASLSRSAANNSFKTIISAVDFLDFVMSNPTKTSPKAIPNQVKIGSGAVPGALGGDLETILVPGWPKA